MVRLTVPQVGIGNTFCIGDVWCSQVAKKIGEMHYPSNFKVISKVENGYLCESIGDKVAIVVSDSIMSYLKGNKVDDVSDGRYFSDYLPDENSKLLICDSSTQSIYPTKFVFSVDVENDVPYLNFMLENLLDGAKCSLISHRDNTWKLLNASNTSMTDVEKMYEDTFIHKEYVLEVCNRFAGYLKEHGLVDEAKALIERAIVHDNSKIVNNEEFRALTGIVNDKSCLEDASSQLSKFKQDSIKLHWKHNAHHPEHFENYDEMSKVDRMEMVCDWMARSLQYKSDLLKFVKTRQEERFHFSDEMFEEIYYYCNVLVSLYKS